MNIREISKPVTAKGLNESLAKRFGQKINIDAFTLEQLQDVRNRIRTKLSQVETNESFDTVVKDEGYQKSKLFLDVLNAAIVERENIAEATGCPCNVPAGGKCTCPASCKDCDCKTNESAKPDFADIDGDGNKKETMKKAAADKKKKTKESIVREGAEDAAELVMAAKDMVDRVTGWMEDTAEMQTESMLELADAIRDEMGSEKSEAFVASIKPALESLYAAMESARGTLTSGVGMLTGEEVEPLGAPAGDEALPPMGDEPMDEIPPMEPIEGEDDFGADAAAAGGTDEAGRAKRESVDRKISKKKVVENSRKIATILSKKKA